MASTIWKGYITFGLISIPCVLICRSENGPHQLQHAA